MAKQQVVLKVSMEDAKKRAKAMQCAVGLHGVVSTSHDGDKITVVGEGIDPVALTMLLRKKMGHAELMTVTALEEKKEEKKGEKKEVEVEAGAKSINNQPFFMIQPPYYYADVSYPDNSCSIM